MNHDANPEKVPKDVPLVPGMVETYHEPDVWTAPDEAEYTLT